MIITHAQPKFEHFRLFSKLSASNDPQEVKKDELPEEFVTHVQPTQQTQAHVVDLSVIDQAVVRCWSSYVLCFSTPEGYTNHELFNHFKDGLSKTIDQFPFIAGELQPKKNAKEGSLEVIIRPDSSVAFGFRDISNLPIAHNMTFEELKGFDFPPSMLESQQLGIYPDPQLTLNNPRQAVFLAQATFVKGGAFLFFAHSHQIADVTGTNSIMRAWSENMSAAAWGEKPRFSQALRDSSLYDDRRRLSDSDRVDPQIPESDFPLRIDHNYARPGMKRQKSTPAYPKDVNQREQNPSMIWRMSPEQLQNLKRLAWPSQKEATNYISTLDAVNALMWRAISRARRLRQRDISSSTMFFVCDVRTKLSPPLRSDSTCNATMKLNTVQSSASLQNDDLSTALRKSASSIRAAICDFTPSKFETWVSYVKSAPSFFSLKPNEQLTHGPDIIVTDHSKVAAYSYQWGPLGNISRIRNPWWARSFPKPNSQVTLMPRLQDGGLEILTNVEEHIGRQLLADPELRQWASILCC